MARANPTLERAIDRMAAPDPGNSCIGKVPYETHGDATLAAKHTQDRHGVKRAYQCRYCRKFHIGHSPKSRAESIKRKFRKKFYG